MNCFLKQPSCTLGTGSATTRAYFSHQNLDQKHGRLVHISKFVQTHNLRFLFDISVVITQLNIFLTSHISLITIIISPPLFRWTKWKLLDGDHNPRLASKSINSKVWLNWTTNNFQRKYTKAQLNTLHNLWVRAVFMTLVNISLSYQTIINIWIHFGLSTQLQT